MPTQPTISFTQIFKHLKKKKEKGKMMSMHGGDKRGGSSTRAGNESEEEDYEIEIDGLQDKACGELGSGPGLPPADRAGFCSESNDRSGTRLLRPMKQRQIRHSSR
ncbi:hypothetical protein CK203_092005 [Vitis vinifera]|uniref:Uncharacterized protein n=1 Tax=Vitis vinifera TaxID=29760 RepID=A0A438CWC8_VITVI|nr:hypothetical protein CK203_092005 [Vitis vinifera]